MIPYRAPFFLPWLYPSLTWRIGGEKKELYLTFDDGPVPGPTEFVLDQLARSSVKATFFCIGDNVCRNPDIFRKIFDGGHTVGNHTCNHVNGWKTSTEKYVANVQGFEEIAGGTTNLFRPPYGRMTLGQIKRLREYRIIMWDVLSHDYNRSLSPEQCLRGTLAACRPGSIIVFHDSYKSQRNMEYALPRLIDSCSAQGYTFKRM